MNVVIHKDSRRTLIEYVKDEVFRSAKVVIVNDTIPIGDHYHLKKDEVFLLLKGQFLELTLGENTAFNVLSPYKVEVGRGLYHKFICTPGSILLGVATAPFDPEDELKL